MTITIDTSVGRIAAEAPLATRIFERYGIDYCCGGATSLSEACREKGIDASAVAEEIREETERLDTPERRWTDGPLAELVSHILTEFHEPLHEELPRLGAMVRKVLEVHRDKAPDTLPELARVFLALEEELEQHMAKEEQILFPMILRGQGAMAEGPVSVMHHEHEEAAEALRRMRALTNDYTVPAEACNTWRALWRRLEVLEEDLHRHIHLENNILFPRALAT